MSRGGESDNKSVNKSDNEVDVSELKVEGDNNSIGTVEQAINDEAPEIPLQTNDQYNGMLMFYRAVCNHIPDTYQTPIFGGAGILGLFSLGYKIFTTTGFSNIVFFDWMYWVGGFGLFFGVGYFLIGGDCESCGARFSLTNTEKREINRQERSGKSDRIQVCKVYKCENCLEEEVRTYWTTEGQGKESA